MQNVYTFFASFQQMALQNDFRDIASLLHCHFLCKGLYHSFSLPFSELSLVGLTLTLDVVD